MDWKQDGNIHRCDNYTIIEHDQNGKRWCTLEYGDRYLGRGNFATVSAAKHAASEHADSGHPQNELLQQSKAHSSLNTSNSEGAQPSYYECNTCHTVFPLIEGMPRDKCGTCGTTNGRVISKEQYDEGWKAGVYFNILGKKSKRKPPR